MQENSRSNNVRHEAKCAWRQVFIQQCPVKALLHYVIHPVWVIQFGVGYRKREKSSPNPEPLFGLLHWLDKHCLMWVGFGKPKSPWIHWLDKLYLIPILRNIKNSGEVPIKFWPTVSNVRLQDKATIAGKCQEAVWCMEQRQKRRRKEVWFVYKDWYPSPRSCPLCGEQVVAYVEIHYTPSIRANLRVWSLSGGWRHVVKSHGGRVTRGVSYCHWLVMCVSWSAAHEIEILNTYLP